MEAPNSRPNSAPMITALAVNSAIDCDGGNVRLESAGRRTSAMAGTDATDVAMAPDISMPFCYNLGRL